MRFSNTLSHVAQEVFWNDQFKALFFRKCTTILLLSLPLLVFALYVLFDIDHMSGVDLNDVFIKMLTLKALLIITLIAIVLSLYHNSHEILVLFGIAVISSIYFCAIPLINYNEYKDVNTSVRHVIFNRDDISNVVDLTNGEYINPDVYCSNDAGCDFPVYMVKIEPTVGNNIRINLYHNMNGFPFHSSEISASRLSIKNNSLLIANQ